MATLKDLKLKTGICKRGLKELQSYETEVQREAAKTTAMKERNADPYDLKQQVCVARCSLKLNWSGMCVSCMFRLCVCEGLGFEVSLFCHWIMYFCLYESILCIVN
jgi:hypothetical protein